MVRRWKLGFDPSACLERIVERLRASELEVEHAVAMEKRGQPELDEVRLTTIQECSSLSLAFIHLGRHASPKPGCPSCGMSLAISEIVFEQTDREARAYVEVFLDSIDDALVAIAKLSESFQQYQQGKAAHEEGTRNPLLSWRAFIRRGFFTGFSGFLVETSKTLMGARRVAASQLLGVVPPSRKARGRPSRVLRDVVQKHLTLGGLSDREISELLGLEGFQTTPKEIVRKGRQRMVHRRHASTPPRGKKTG